MFSTVLTIVLVTILLKHSDGYSTIQSPRAVTNTSKAGLAWPNGVGVDVKQYQTTGKVSWYYSWSPYSFDTELEFVPMLWSQGSVDQFSTSINQTILQRHVVAVLGMNEPQETSQANLTAEDGARLWKMYLEPLRAQGIRLGSPAPSSAPSGKTWLQAFLSACAGGCTVDFIATHWYGVNATAFMQYLQDYHDTFQRPLWVTEWACQNFEDRNAQCSKDDIVLFLNKTQSFMDNSDFVERYAWFGAMTDMQGLNKDNVLMDQNGKINDLGRQYIGSEPPKTSGSGRPRSSNNGDGIAVGDGVHSTSFIIILSSAVLLTVITSWG